MTLRVSASQAKRFLGGGRSVSVETRRHAQAPARGRGSFGLDRELRPVVDSVDLILPFPPSVNDLTFNKEDGGRAKTSRYEDWLAEAGWRLQQSRPGRIAGPYEIELRLARPDRRRRDLGNLEKAVSDLLVRHKIIADDSLAERITLSWQHDDTGVRVIVSNWRGRA